MMTSHNNAETRNAVRRPVALVYDRETPGSKRFSGFLRIVTFMSKLITATL